MVDAMANYVTREEFNPVKEGLERLTIRVEVLTSDLHRLSQQVGDLAEDVVELREAMHARFDEVDARFFGVDARFDVLTNEVNGRFTSLEKTITDGHAAIISVLMKLLPR
jgi:tetrahydromethanopterin S-methyltransferase subunit G